MSIQDDDLRTSSAGLPAEEAAALMEADDVAAEFEQALRAIIAAEVATAGASRFEADSVRRNGASLSATLADGRCFLARFDVDS